MCALCKIGAWTFKFVVVVDDSVMYLITETVMLLIKNLFTYHFHSSYVKITSFLITTTQPCSLPTKQHINSFLQQWSSKLRV